MWAINLPASQIETETDRLEAIIKGYASTNHETDEANLKYRDFNEAQLKLQLLATFGNLRAKMPAELTELRDHLGQMVDEGSFDAMCFSESFENAVQAAVQAAAPAIVGNPSQKGVQPEKTPFLYSLVGMWETKWQQLTRFCRDKTTRDRSRQAMARIEDLIQSSYDRQFNHLATQKQRLLAALKNTYGSTKAAKQALTQPLDESLWAQLDRGTQHTQWTVGRLLQMYVSCIQTEDYGDNCAKYNRGADYVAFLEDTINALDPRHMQLVAALREIYSQQGAELSEVFMKTAGVPLLTPNRNYMPVVPLRDVAVAKRGEGRAYSPYAASLTPRVKHDLDFDQTADIIDVFLDRAEDAAHTVGFAETGSLIMAITQSDDILNALRKEHGKAVAAQWNNYILDILAGTRRAQTGREASFANHLARYASRLYIGLNPVSWLKQIESVPCYALSLDGNTKDVLAACSYWALRPIEAARVAHDLSQTKAFSARYGLAISQELKYATKDEGVFKSWFSRLMEKSMSGVYVFDKLGVFFLAPVYRRKRAALERDGVSPNEASEMAAASLMHIIDKTAQTARTINSTELQRAGGLAALVLQFKSAPAQQTQFEIAAVQDALSRKDDVKAWKKALAVITINHIIVPTINSIIESAFAMLVNLDLPDEEKRKRLLAILCANLLSGSWGSVAFLGVVIEGVSSMLFDALIEDRKPSLFARDANPVPAMTAVDTVVSNVSLASKAIDEFNEGDIEQAVIDMLTAVGGSLPAVAWPTKTAAKIYKSVKEK